MENGGMHSSDLLAASIGSLGDTSSIYDTYAHDTYAPVAGGEEDEGDAAAATGSNMMSAAAVAAENGLMPAASMGSGVGSSALIPFMDENPRSNKRQENVMTVHNVLASAYLGAVKLDLDRICANFGNSYYNPDDFRATRIDVRGRCGSVYSISIFENGKIQSAGGCWPEEARRSMMKIAKKLANKMGYHDVRFQKFEVQNILAVIDVGHGINLNRLCQLYRNVDYEPERFPVARIRVPMPSKSIPSSGPVKSSPSVDVRRSAARIYHQPKEEVVSVNVFSTGKITFTGGKSIDSIRYSLNEVRPFIQMSKLK